MARYSSDSDSDSRKRSSKKSKKKSKSRKRSRSTSYESRRSRDSRRRSRSRSRDRSYSSDRSGRSRSRDERRRRHRSRSRSEDSYRSRKTYRRSRSKTRSPRRRRSRSRDSRDDDRYSRRHKSRSRSRERSKKKKKAKKKSRERSPVLKEKKKDPCEDIPGFAEMTPAQQSRLRVQAAFDAAEAKSSTEKSEKLSSAAVESAIDQMERAQVIEDIEDSDFMQTHFSSSRSNKSKEISKMPSWPSNLAEQEDYHEMAIFGNSAALSLDEKTKKEISDAAEPLVKRTIKWEDRDPKTLAHPNLHITHEQAEKRWLDKLNSMRREKLKSRGM